jgi:hypothetical protein
LPEIRSTVPGSPGLTGPDEDAPVFAGLSAEFVTCVVYRTDPQCVHLGARQELHQAAKVPGGNRREGALWTLMLLEAAHRSRMPDEERWTLTARVDRLIADRDRLARELFDARTLEADDLTSAREEARRLRRELDALRRAVARAGAGGPPDASAAVAPAPAPARRAPAAVPARSIPRLTGAGHVQRERLIAAILLARPDLADKHLERLPGLYDPEARAAVMRITMAMSEGEVEPDPAAAAAFVSGPLTRTLAAMLRDSPYHEDVEAALCEAIGRALDPKAGVR